MSRSLKSPINLLVLFLLLAIAANPLQAASAAPAAQTASAIRVNQAGYLPALNKLATIVSSSTSPITWQLKNSANTVVASGTTTVIGNDVASGENVHIANFSTYQTQGTGYTLSAGGANSYAFDISANVYAQMKYDALAYFYHNRSGIAITMPYAGGTQWTRPAGHIGVAPNTGDTSVTCGGTPSYSCNYSLNVTGGWYDAGDQGKYVVNGGISVWTMMNQYERAKYLGTSVANFGDGRMSIPENANGVPDILDEARWEMEFILKMQVPAGQTYAGMVHHKMHDATWTGLPTRPDQDAAQRVLRPVSTAATLNLAATAAQCARIWASIDTTFSNKCLSAAQTAWNAAQANPAMYITSGDGTGGGAYDDNNVTDEFFWAAAELYITTGSATYQNYLTSSTHFKTIPGGGTMSWATTGALGNISLVTAPNNLSAADKTTIKNNIAAAANGYISTINGQGYRLPITSYDWGSNSAVTNAAIVMALAYDFTSNASYLNGVHESMNYLLGRNAMNKSYVSGYGENPLTNPHHRFWAYQNDATYPHPPAGALSGGPHGGMEDPVAQQNLAGCKPQKCYIDDIGAYSVNEITVNWNAPFAWVAAYLDEKAGGSNGPTPTPSLTFTPTNTSVPSSNIALNKPATSSSNESATYPASLAVDGNGTTRWASAFADPQWIQVDLGSTQTINRVVLNWEAAYGKDFQIQTSNDGTNWTTIKTVTGNTATTNDYTVTGSGRYIRMYGTARGTTYGYSLYEFQVYAPSGPTSTPTNTQAPVSATPTKTFTPTNTQAPVTNTATPTKTFTPSATTAVTCGTTNIAQGKTATSSTNESATYPANLAVDGNTTTRWASAFQDNQWLQVDLGATYNLCRAQLVWEAAYASAFNIQVSNDGTNWTTVQSVMGNTSLNNDLTFSGSGRYVRVYGVTRATAYGISLYEFRVFNTGAVPTATSTSAASATPTATTGGAVEVIYADATTWDNWSWDGTYNLAATSPVKSGTRSISVAYTTGKQGGLSLRRTSAMNTAGFSKITFWVYGGAGGTGTLVFFIHTSDSSAASTQVNFSAPAGVWTQISIPLSALGSPAQLARINIMNGTTVSPATFYIDDIQVAP